VFSRNALYKSTFYLLTYLHDLYPCMLLNSHKNVFAINATKTWESQTSKGI